MRFYWHAAPRLLALFEITSTALLSDIDRDTSWFESVARNRSTVRCVLMSALDIGCEECPLAAGCRIMAIAQRQPREVTTRADDADGRRARVGEIEIGVVPAAFARIAMARDRHTAGVRRNHKGIVSKTQEAVKAH